MEKKKFKFPVIPAKALFLTLFLLCAFLGLALFFAYGFDAEKRFVNDLLEAQGYDAAAIKEIKPQVTDDLLAALPLPFVLPLPIFLCMEFFNKRKEYQASYAPQGYRTILLFSLIAEAIFLIAGIVMLVTYLQRALPIDDPTFSLLSVGVMFLPGTVTYLILCLVYILKEQREGYKKAALWYTAAILLSLAGWVVGIVCSHVLHYGWSLFYLAGVMALVIVLMADAEPGEEMEQHQANI